MSLMKSLLLLMSALLSIKSYAQDFSIGIVELRGTGCPQGSHGSVVSPDGSALSILFDQFSAVVPNESTNNDNDEADNDILIPGVHPKLQKAVLKAQKALSRKACNIVLSAAIPADQKVIGLDIQTDVRGAVMMEEGTEAAFQSLFVGKKGLGFKGQMPEKSIVGHKIWKANKGELIEDWTFSKNHFHPLVSGCAKKADRKIQLNLKTILYARMLNPFIKLAPRGEVVIDSSDIVGSLKVKVKTQPCK